MTAITTAPVADPTAEATPTEVDVFDAVHQRVDRLLLAGCVTGGTFLMGPVGLVLMLLGYRHFRRARDAGHPVRDSLITIVAVFCLLDASMNFVGWSVETFAHDTLLGQTLWGGYGRVADAAYLDGYNSASIGGTPLAGEKALQLGSVLFLFPIRVAACWAFLKMKRWGLQMMVITSWMYAFLWLVYLSNIAMDFDPRLTHNLYGLLGWHGINIWFVTPFLTLPYLYTVKKENWSN